MAADRMADYEPVQARIVKFWEKYPDGQIDVELPEHDDVHVVAKALLKRHIDDPEPFVVGWAQEVHDGSPVNRQGWMLENAETSAIGRALANAGFATKTARPTQEDMERAAQREQAAWDAGAYTFDKIKAHAGTPIAEQLKAFATEHGHTLGKKYLQTNPEWRTQVDAHYLQLTDAQTATT